MPIADLLRPLIKRLLRLHIAHLVKDSQRTAAKQRLVWAYSEGYFDDDEISRLMLKHGLVDA
jgi:hypothetical protein